MKLTLAIPVMNQLEDTKKTWQLHIKNIVDKENLELLVINNGSTDDTVRYLTEEVFPHFPHHKLVNNAENVGVVHSMNQCISESTGEVIAIMHNDLWVLEEGWDNKVRFLFNQYPRAGLAGFFGALGIGRDGGRIYPISNMVDAENHGARFEGVRRCVGFDGMSLIGRRAMFEQVGGFDESYSYHHFYDKDISLTSHFAGWENYFIGISCQHVSGVTANRPDYQEWAKKKMNTGEASGDIAIYKKSEDRLFEKWLSKLPIMV